MPVAELGDSNALQVGDLVLAVGNPLGFESTVTMGIVSALGRRGPQGQTSSYTDYIQTDAAINQGNSGGALVNIDGQVVGINTWIAAPSGGNVGLGFAIPINNAKTAIDDFITKGRVQYGWLGALIGDIQDPSTYPDLAKDMKVDGVKGALVLDLYKGSPADRAGLRPGDYVTAVGSTPVSDANQLTQVIGSIEAGRSTSLSVIRLGEQKTLTVTIGERDAKDQVAQAKNLWPGMTVVDHHGPDPPGRGHSRRCQGRGGGLFGEPGDPRRHRGIPARGRDHRGQREDGAEHDGLLPRAEREPRRLVPDRTGQHRDHHRVVAVISGQQNHRTTARPGSLPAGLSCLRTFHYLAPRSIIHCRRLALTGSSGPLNPPTSRWGKNGAQ